ncbi:RnfABCDGE type electron transport complex subunit D [uncultured Treponema sp.]|uniref:RnfABCDGE type electron transport complex subunit D n=1 Tax=uncultured Treponema sp. TaxID=162155 RepID=UPI0025E3D35C|nr:RnfABCDGE type electron transport complex subunit D [uncultured Treponema sp.]
MKNKVPAHEFVFLSPFVYLKPSIRSEAYTVLFLLLLQVAMLFVTRSFSSLIIILAALIASYAGEFINAEKNYRDSLTVITSTIRALAIGLMLPAGFPPLAVFFITFFVVFLNKHTLGGFANSWINPVAITVAICWIIGMNFFPVVSISEPALQSRNIALTLIQNGTFPMNSFDVPVTNFLNRRLFSFFGVSIPEGYFSLFWDSHSLIPAFRFNLLTILSSIVLLGTDVLNPIIPTVFIFTYAVLVKLLAPLFYNGFFLHGDVLLALLSSGTLFGTFFLLSWHGTTPYSNRGKWFYGFFAGCLAFFILGIGLSPVGFAFIILVTNIFSLVIQEIENRFIRDYTNSVLVQKVKAVREGIDA